MTTRADELMDWFAEGEAQTSGPGVRPGVETLESPGIGLCFTSGSVCAWRRGMGVAWQSLLDSVNGASERFSYKQQRE